jgi:hypothetical protein
MMNEINHSVSDINIETNNQQQKRQQKQQQQQLEYGCVVDDTNLPKPTAAKDATTMAKRKIFPTPLHMMMMMFVVVTMNK